MTITWPGDNLPPAEPWPPKPRSWAKEEIIMGGIVLPKGFIAVPRELLVDAAQKLRTVEKAFSENWCINWDTILPIAERIEVYLGEPTTPGNRS